MSDRKEAAKVAKQIAKGNAQLKIPHYFQLTSKQQAKKSAEDQVEKQHAIHKILQQSTFNFSKLHYLSLYGSEISLFKRLPQYYTQITESLYKPLKDAYRSSNRVDVVGQVLDTISRDDALQIEESNLIAYSRDIRLPIDIQTLLGIEKCKVASVSTQSPSVGRPVCRGRQAADSPAGASLASLATALEIPSLAEKFGNYSRLNHPLKISHQPLSRCPAQGRIIIACSWFMSCSSTEMESSFIR